jgi:hypothetical protein
MTKKKKEAQTKTPLSQSELNELLCAFASLMGCIEADANTTHKFHSQSPMCSAAKIIIKTGQYMDAKRLLLKHANFKESA